MRGDEPRSSDEALETMCGAAALASLATTGVLASLIAQRASVTELARAHALDAGALRRTLEVIRALGWLTRDGDTYGVEPRLAAEAARGPAPLDKVLFLLQMLPEHLRTGASLLSEGDDRGASYAQSTPGLSRMFEPQAVLLAEVMHRPEIHRILDVGAGAGVWSLTMAQGGDCEVTALDLEPVLARFAANAKRRGVRHKTLAGDYHTAPVEGLFDRVLLANVLHLERPERAQSLLARAARWTGNRGELVVVDALFPDRGNALAVAAYGLHLGMRVEGAQVYDAENVEAWCAPLGLEVTARHVLDDSRGAGALVLRRPSTEDHP